MGSWVSHLRIAELLLNHLTEVDRTAFTFGNLAPDSGLPNANWTVFDPPKEISHFLSAGSNENNVQDLIFYRQYLQPCNRRQNPATYSFLLGYFVHLVSDRLWSNKIGKPSRQCYAELFAIHSEAKAWDIIKEDWYGLDQLFVRSHPESLFWQVFLSQPIPLSPLPFVKQSAFEQQMQFIRTFYSQPSPHWQLDRLFPYLNEASMKRYVEETCDCLVKILRLLPACPPPSALTSATLLLSSTETEAFLPPLGDLPLNNDHSQ